MSGACSEHITMDPGSFSTHIDDLAEKIKDKIAKLAAESVHQDAIQAQTAVEMALNAENLDRQTEAANNGGTFTPAQVGADNGYSLLSESWKEFVNDYRDNYQIDLLTFTSSDAGEAESALKNEHLTWIPELFTRGGNLPKPGDSDDAITALSDLAGSGAILSLESPEDGADWADGSFGSVAETDIATIQAATKPWDSGAADVFRTVFLPKVPTAAANQIDVMRAMRNLLAAHRGILLLARGSVDAIAHDCLEVLEGFDECCKGGVSLETVLGVAAGVVAIAGGIATLAAGGSGIALIGAGIGILSGAVKTVQTLDGAINGDDTMAVAANHELGGDNVDDVVDNLKEALDTTYADLDEAYTELSGLMGALDGLMSGSPTKIRAPRPGGSPGLLDTDQGNVVDTTGG